MPRGSNYVNHSRGVDEPQRSSAGKNDVCIPFLAGKCTFEMGCRKRHPSKDEIPRLLARYKKTRCRFRDECYTEGCLFLHPNEEKQKGPSFIAPHHFPPLSSVCTTPRSSSPDSTSKQATASDSAWTKNPPTMVADPPAKDPAASRVLSSPTSVQQQQVDPKQPPTAWGHPNEANGEPPIIMDTSPPQHHPVPPIPLSQQEYYIEPPMMVPNMAPPVIDPNSGYPLDPSVYYYDEQAFYYHQQMMAPYPIVPGPSMAIQFNAEAKEFVPGMFTA